MVHNRSTECVVPEGAVLLSRTPLTKAGTGCELNGDIDRFGRIVMYKDGQWYAWYPNANEPLI